MKTLPTNTNGDLNLAYPKQLFKNLIKNPT